MKNFITLIEPHDIVNYIGNLWRSDLFKQSHNDPQGYIYQLATQFSYTPRVFCDMHEETMEMVHFSSWFNAIQHRYYYTDDILHDLYYHHEIFHLITMKYSANLTFETWKIKMHSNEFWASLESEALIYFYMPELRALSFKNTLWVDRFLEDSYYKNLFGKYFDKEDDLSRKLKSRIAYFRDECEFNPKDNIEKQIASYAISSDEFSNIWNKNESWINVECHMTYYLNLVKTNPSKALEEHLSWLSDLQKKDSHNIAFGNEARAYSSVHKSLFQSAYTPKN